MTERKFIIENEEVVIQGDQIKNYFMYPECYFKEDTLLLPFPGKVYVSEDGNYCNGLDCSIQVPSILLDEKGNALTHETGTDEGYAEGFIYEGKLYFTNSIEETTH